MSRAGVVERIERALGELVRLSSSQRVHAERLRATGLDISRSEFRFLRTIGDDRLSVSQVAQIIGLSQPTASRTLRALEGRALVSRASVEFDGRVAAYAMTEQGRRVLHRLEDHMHRQLTSALDDIPASKRTELADQLEDLVGRLKAAPAVPPAGPTSARAPAPAPASMPPASARPRSGPLQASTRQGA
jgi:DNA-binding MarR family transcriptional regulator